MPCISKCPNVTLLPLWISFIAENKPEVNEDI